LHIGFLLAARSFLRRFAPRKQIDWIVRVLQEIWACLVDQVVCEFVFSHSSGSTLCFANILQSGRRNG
jgi:hypothetical protein